MEGSSSPSPSNVSEILKLKKALKEAEEKLERQKNKSVLESDVYQMSRQYNEIIETMVVIIKDQGKGRRRGSEVEGMDPVLEILRCLDEKIEVLVLKEDQGVIGSVLRDLATMGGLIKRMKLKMASATNTSNAVGETATSSTKEEDGGGPRQKTMTQLRGSGEKSCRDVKINVEDDDNGASIEAKKEPVKVAPPPPTPRPSLIGERSVCLDAPGLVVSSASMAPPPLVVSPASMAPPNPPDPVAPLISSQAKQLSGDGDASTSGEPRRRSGRLEKIPRKDYSDPDPPVESEEFVLYTVRSRAMQKDQLEKYVCPNSQCGEEFSCLKDWTNHVIGHARKDVGLKCDVGSCDRIFGNRQSLNKHKKEKHPRKCNSSKFPNVAAGGEMLCTDGVTISVSRKRPKMDPSSTLTDPKGSNSNRSENDHQDDSAGGKGKATSLAAGSSSRMHKEED